MNINKGLDLHPNHLYKPADHSRTVKQHRASTPQLHTSNSILYSKSLKMKASLIALLPVACYMQGALAAPTVEAKAVTSAEHAKRTLNLPDLSALTSAESATANPLLDEVSVLVTEVIGLVSSIGT